MTGTPARKRAAAVAGICVVVAVAGWLLLVSPKRSEAADLSTRADQLAVEVQTARLAAGKARRDPELPELAALKRTMPDELDTPQVLRELHAIGVASGVEFSSVTPLPQVTGTGFVVHPFTVEFEGSFPEITRLLATMRKQVTVRKAVLRANGRLLNVEKLDLSTLEGDKSERLKATFTLGTFVYGGGAGSGA